MQTIILLIVLNTPTDTGLVVEPFKNAAQCEAAKQTAIKAVARTSTTGFSIRSVECVVR